MIEYNDNYVVSFGEFNASQVINIRVSQHISSASLSNLTPDYKISHELTFLSTRPTNTSPRFHTFPELRG